MATYAPPSETLPIFNPSVFLTNDAGDFLAFPVAQGSETFPFGLTASSLTTVDPTTIDSLVMSDLNPQYKIDYPVNSGRIDFYSNTAGGVSTRGGKIDATGVHTISKFDTIDETAGTLDIGTLAARTGSINIGTGADGTSARTINIGNSTGAVGALNLKTRTITVGGNNCVTLSSDGTTHSLQGTTMNIKTTSTSGVLSIGTGMTSDTINIGTANSSTTAINIGSGTGNKSIIIGQAGDSVSSLTRLRGYQIDLNPALGGILNIGTFMTSGTINIGTANASTTPIEIGTGTGEKTITIGLAGTTTASLTRLKGFQIDLNPALSGTLNLGASMTSGSIEIGSANSSSTSISIGNGTTVAKSISIGNLDTGTTLIRSQTLSLNAKLDGGTLNLGQAMTGSGSSINIGTESTSQTPISIGTGTGTKTITIGNTTGTTVALAGSTITASKMAVAGTLSGGATTLTSCLCNTYTGATMTITPTTSLAIGGTTSANSPFFNNVGGTTSINGGTNTQSIEIGHGQTTGVINIGNITTRTGAINVGFSGQTTSLTANAVTINLGDTSTTGGIIVGVPFRPNWNAQTYTYTSAEMGYQTTQTPATVAIATGATTNLTGTFTLGNGVWMIVLTVQVNSSATTAAAWYRVGLSKTSGTFENDRKTDFAPTTTVGDNFFVTTYIVQSSASQTWYVLGAQAGVTTTIANTNIRVQQTRIS